jgi:hypothetical protein
MKTYQVEFKRISYVTLTIKADNEEQAENMAWDEASSLGDFWSDAEWFIESAQQEKVTA